jgi:hypothetical protein
LLQQHLEAMDIDIARGHRDRVPLRTALDQFGTAEELAQPRDICLDDPAGIGPQGVTPDCLSQLVQRDQFTGAQ